MLLNENQVNEYSKCPIYYDCVFNKNLPFEKTPSLNTLLNRVANSFYVNLMHGRVLRMSQLKSKWDRICEQHQDIVTQQKCLEGLSLLDKMHRWAADEEIRILDVKMPYTFVLNKDLVIEYKSEIDVIAINKKDQVELLFTDFSNKYPDQEYIDLKLKYTLDYYAFKKYYKREAGIRIHNIKNNKSFYTNRSKDDIIRAKEVLNNIAISINKKLYYPREGIFCKTCEMKSVCRFWKL